MNFWNQKSFCLITGASRGIGREIAIQFAQNVKEGSVLCLLARSEEGLEGTKKMIEENVGNKVFVNIFPIDLFKPNAEEYLSIIKSSAGDNCSEFEQNLLVHNAASTGNLGTKYLLLDDLEDWKEYYTMNVFSMVILTAQFFKVFNDSSKDRMIVQISSMAYDTPLSSMSQYCSGKAARNMLMKVMAEEESTIKIMSYAPGGVDTEMYNSVIVKSYEEKTRDLFKNSKTGGYFLTCQESVGHLVKILSENKYFKGEHVDYYDTKLKMNK